MALHCSQRCAVLAYNVPVGKTVHMINNKIVTFCDTLISQFIIVGISLLVPIAMRTL